VNFSRTVWITFHLRGTTSNVSVTSSPSLDRRPLQQGQAVGPGITTRSRGRCAGKGPRTGLRRIGPRAARSPAVSGSRAASSSAAAASNSSIELATVGEMFRNVAFIVFNYDRCVEQFLSEALKAYFALDDVTIMKVLATVDIFHPYGTIGDHPLWRRGGISFGAEPSASELRRIAERVKTFTERIEEGEELQRMRDLLAGASRKRIH